MQQGLHYKSRPAGVSSAALSVLRLPAPPASQGKAHP